jgi:hypothetical protein
MFGGCVLEITSGQPIQAALGDALAEDGKHDKYHHIMIEWIRHFRLSD